MGVKILKEKNFIIDVIIVIKELGKNCAGIFWALSRKTSAFKEQKCFRPIHQSRKNIFRIGLGLRGKKIRERDLKNTLDPNSQDVEA